jgi:hypothetical protein
MSGFPKWMRMVYGKRVEWRCERCGKSFYDGWMLEAHHRIPTSQGGEDTFENMEFLCVQCHYNVHIFLASKKKGHSKSPQIIARRLKRTGGRTERWIREHIPH